MRRIAGEIADALVPSLRSHADELASRGFAEAGYVGDELEGDVTPRLDLLQQLTTY